jgi:hypothetical protein
MDVKIPRRDKRNPNQIDHAEKAVCFLSPLNLKFAVILGSSCELKQATNLASVKPFQHFLHSGTQRNCLSRAFVYTETTSGAFVCIYNRSTIFIHVNSLAVTGHFTQGAAGTFIGVNDCNGAKRCLCCHGDFSEYRRLETPAVAGGTVPATPPSHTAAV